jgi:hypothetical protein
MPFEKERGEKREGRDDGRAGRDAVSLREGNNKVNEFMLLL